RCFPATAPVGGELGMSTAQGFSHPEFLVETDALERQLGNHSLRVLDCTTHLIPDPKITYQVVPGRADFEKGHIPGAQFVDLLGDLSDKNHRSEERRVGKECRSR